MQREPSFYLQNRYRFSEEEVQRIANKTGISLVAGIEYSRRELNDMGIQGKTAQKLRAYLESLGVYRTSYESYNY